jgi:predicted phosphoribosyltransferase
LVDDVVCATTPSPYFAVGASYWDFERVSDEEVRRLLREAGAQRPKLGTRGGAETFPHAL